MQTQMEPTTEIVLTETALREAGKSVAELCRAAGISPTTWWRWKAEGRLPRESTRRAVRNALVEMLPPVRQEAA